MHLKNALSKLSDRNHALSKPSDCLHASTTCIAPSPQCLGMFADQISGYMMCMEVQPRSFRSKCQWIYRLLGKINADGDCFSGAFPAEKLNSSLMYDGGGEPSDQQHAAGCVTECIFLLMAVCSMAHETLRQVLCLTDVPWVARLVAALQLFQADHHVQSHCEALDNNHQQALGVKHPLILVAHTQTLASYKITGLC